MVSGRRGWSDDVDALFRLHEAAIRRYLVGRVGPADGDDLVAETFLAACQSFGAFDSDRGSPIGWLFGIANNVLRSHARQERRHLRTLQQAALKSVGPGEADAVDDRVDAGALVRRLLPDLLGLDPVDRDILLLVSWGGLQPGQVAEVLHLPAGTVRSRLSRTRVKLRRAADLAAGDSTASPREEFSQ